MNLGNYNSSINCSVKECKHHTENDHCSLDHIEVVNSWSCKTNDDCEWEGTQAITDCGSFEPR